MKTKILHDNALDRWLKSIVSKLILGVDQLDFAS
jgi:hypothetical protein